MISNNKIAILTQPLNYNYGGIIQNFALQKVLKNLGYDPITIDRVDENPHSKIKIIANKCKLWIYRYILGKKSPIYSDYSRIILNNLRFIKKNIKVSKGLASTEELKSYFEEQNFSAVVVGSDQVWRPLYSPYISNFFLDFLQGNTTIKKLSYAASFGTSEWEFSDEQASTCIPLIQYFDGVSVREKDGVNLCNNFLKRDDAIYVLDPTLLLQSNDYNQLINKGKQSLGLFTYVLDQSHNISSFIKEASQFLSLDIYQNQAILAPKNINIDNLGDYIIPPIEGWLQGFRDAEYIITDSFHGTVFSIINRKPFFALVNKDRGASRFESLLEQLGLEDRLIYDIDTFDLSNLNNNIDYNTVAIRLDELRNHSVDFLKKYL